MLLSLRQWPGCLGWDAGGAPAARPAAEGNVVPPGVAALLVDKRRARGVRLGAASLACWL
jgi:hypothetical protein